MPMEVTDELLDEYYSFALELAKKAGTLITETFHKEKVIDTKTCAADLVTQTDQAVEKLVFSLIKKKYPSHKLIGEETTAETGAQLELTDDPTWIIDPVDGTTNFVHRIPEVAFSLGVTINKEPVFGIVYLPVKEQMYTAKKGRGAFLNGRKLSCSGQTELSQSVIVIEGGSSRDAAVLEKKITNVHCMVSASHGVRSYGSAAHNLCRVAQGSGDAYVEYGIHIWDFVAGMLIVQEAGGHTQDPEGGPVDLLRRRILAAASPAVAKQMSEILVHIDTGRD